MSTNHLIRIDNIDITLRKSSATRNIIIKIKPQAGVVISVPQRVSFKTAQDFASENIDWIRKHLEKMLERESKRQVYDQGSGFVTRNHILDIQTWHNNNISVRISNGKIFVKYPLSVDVKSHQVQNAVRKGIERALKEEAKEYLPKRLNDLSDKFNLPYNEVFIKNIKSRWGSCSFRNNINLSIHLIRLPDNLIDYVLAHELAHTKIKNHSKRYWQFLTTLIPTAKQSDKELKKYSASVI